MRWPRSLSSIGEDISDGYLSQFGAVAAPCDVLESEQAFEVIVDLPGWEAEEVEIVAEEGRLFLTGKPRETTAAVGRLIHCERQHAPFARTFLLPEGLQIKKVRASLKNGVLRVALPKPASDKKALDGRRVPISKL